METIARFSTPVEARIAWSRLDAAGIPAFVADEHTINMQWLYSDALGGVRLQVPAEWADRARELLASEAQLPEVPPEQPGEPRCPHCGGREFGPGTRGRRMAFLTWLLAGLPLWPVRRQRRCRGCGALL